MRHFQVGTWIGRPQAEVFALVSDHERFVSGPRETCRILQPGTRERNGEDAVREVKIDAGTFIEKIVRFDPPNAFEFEILEHRGPSGLPMPLECGRGWITFSEARKGTQVDCHFQIAINVPFIGDFSERMAESLTTRLLRTFLKRAKEILESNTDT